MRFTWFNFMPWPYLPADFAQTHRSVWVDVDSRLFDPVRGHALYNSHLDLLEYAATLGYDGIGVNEHHQTAYGMMPSPNLFAAALARRTRDAAIVVLGPSIVNYNPPVRVAEELALLDCLSGGRLVAGGAQNLLHRWQGPLRVEVRFGPTVPPAERASARFSVSLSVVSTRIGVLL